MGQAEKCSGSGFATGKAGFHNIILKAGFRSDMMQSRHSVHSCTQRTFFFQRGNQSVKSVVGKKLNSSNCKIVNYES